MQAKLFEQHNAKLSIEKCIETIRECLNVTELTPYVLNELINRIETGCLETVDGEKQQIVSVEWKLAI